MGSPAVDATLNGMVSSGSEEIVTPDEVHVWLYLCTSRCVTLLTSLYQAKKIEVEILSEWLRSTDPSRDAECVILGSGMHHKQLYVHPFAGSMEQL